VVGTDFESAEAKAESGIQVKFGENGTEEALARSFEFQGAALKS